MKSECGLGKRKYGLRTEPEKLMSEGEDEGDGPVGAGMEEEKPRTRRGNSSGYVDLDPAKESPRRSEAAEDEDGKKKGSDGSIRSRKTARRVSGRVSARVEASRVAVKD